MVANGGLVVTTAVGFAVTDGGLVVADGALVVAA